MDFSGWKRKLEASHASSPQATAKALRAFALVEEGLKELGALGHPLHLAEGPGAPLAPWPRLLFHVSAAPNGRLVASPWEAEELGPDWYDTLAEAQGADGRAQQFSGRGGVHRRALPVATEYHGGVEERLAAKAREWHRKRANMEGK